MSVVQPPTTPTRPTRPAVEQPAEVGFFQKEIFGISMWMVIAGALAAVLLLTGGLFMALHKGKSPAIPAETTSYTYLDSLRTAIKRDVVRGVPETDIRQTLLGMGWPVKVVDQL